MAMAAFDRLAGIEIDAERCIELLREAARVAALTRGERALQSMEWGADDL